MRLTLIREYQLIKTDQDSKVTGTRGMGGQKVTHGHGAMGDKLWM